MISTHPAAPAVRFTALGAEAARGAATPTIALGLQIVADDARKIRAIALSADVRIAAQRRRYAGDERERLGELFGDPAQWARTLGSIRWTRATLNVGEFAGTTTVDVPLPCGYDFEVAAAKYLAALAGGEIPVEVLFTGTIFYAGDDGALLSAMIPWESETSLRISVATWREAVDAAFPDSAWLLVRRELFARLQAYRCRGSFADWDGVLTSLLDRAEAPP